jgi:hypothetical protein
LLFGLFADQTHLEHHSKRILTMTSKRLLNMIKSIHAPLSRIVISGFIVFGTIIVSTKISSSDSSSSSHYWVPSAHPFRSGQPVRLERYREYSENRKILKYAGGRKIHITSILTDEDRANKRCQNEQKFLVYTLRDKDGVVRYVGKTSGKEKTPERIMHGRIRRGHETIDEHPELVEARIETVQCDSKSNSGQEDILYWYFEARERGGRGGADGNSKPLLNKKTPLGERTEKGRETAHEARTHFNEEQKSGSVEPPLFAGQHTSDSKKNEDGPLPLILSSSNEAAASAPGGIDFSTLELRYIAEDSGLLADRGLKYAFNATPAAGNKNLNTGRIAAAQASDAFFVWLSLTPDKFWVNLNPNEPDRIIDPQFGKTDAGRILLQSDLQMKKTVAKLIHPDAPLGKQFWKQLNWKDSKTCISFRQWIVPAPATVRDDSNGIYITDAPLQVKMESQYFQSKGTSGFLASCSTLDKKTEVRNESIYRKLILPRIEEAVNKAPEYAELRRVYRSRVAAEWYRQRSESKATAYREMVNNGDVSSWPARQNWSPKQVFNQYVNSFTKGEFHVVHNSKWQEGNIIYTQKKFYVYGGVDFSRVFFKKLSSTDFQKKWGDLRQVTDSSMKSPIADQNGKVWLGGITITGKAFWKLIWFYLIPGTLIALFLIYKIRTRRIRWQ